MPALSSCSQPVSSYAAFKARSGFPLRKLLPDAASELPPCLPPPQCSFPKEYPSGAIAMSRPQLCLHYTVSFLDCF